jgi:hypothetical protein
MAQSERALVDLPRHLEQGSAGMMFHYEAMSARAERPEEFSLRVLPSGPHPQHTLRMLCIALSAITAVHMLAQDTIPRTPSHFDFWLGEWDLVWEGGKGTNTITREMKGYVTHERFADPATNYHGESWTVWDARDKQWKQTWVDDQGNYMTFVGGPVPEGMLLTTHLPDRTTGGTFLYHMVFSNITSDGFDWTWKRSGRGWHMGGEVGDPLRTARMIPDRGRRTGHGKPHRQTRRAEETPVGPCANGSQGSVACRQVGSTGAGPCRSRWGRGSLFVCCCYVGRDQPVCPAAFTIAAVTFGALPIRICSPMTITGRFRKVYSSRMYLR